MKKNYKIEVDCPVCAEKMQEAANATPGVKEATVSFMTLKLTVVFDDNVEDPIPVMQEVLKNCQKVDDDINIFF